MTVYTKTGRRQWIRWFYPLTRVACHCKRLVRFNFHKVYISGPSRSHQAQHGLWLFLHQCTSNIFIYFDFPDLAFVLVFLICSQPHMVM